MSRFVFASITIIAFLAGGALLSLDSEADHGNSYDVSSENERFWVFFTDKGFQDSADILTKTSTRTKIRRRRSQGRSVDVSDLPVFQPYIHDVLQKGAKHHVSSRWLNGITISAPAHVIRQILRLPFVRSVEPVITFRRSEFRTKKTPRPLLAPSDQQSVYGMSSTQIQQAHVDYLHDRNYNGEGVVIAILDTGFDLSHEAFQNINVLAQYDFIHNDEETSDQPPQDDIGQDDHGTEVLSVIAANSPGNLVGVAYAADFLLAKTERISSDGLIFEKEIEEDWWVAGIEWAELKGADIVSSSLGYSDWYSYSDIDGMTAKTTIAADMAVDKGVLVVVSAGNEGKSRDWPYISAPADGFDVIAVGAVDGMGMLADFSSIGPTYDGRIKPDLMAMGDGTYVVAPSSDDEYRRADGTSLATPLVAGTAALLLQSLPDIDSPRLLIKLLKYTASRALSPDNKYGWGVINAEAAYRIGKYPHLMQEVIDWEPGELITEPDHLIVYPNPVKQNSATGRLTIQSPDPLTSIEIYTSSGILIYERLDVDYARTWIWDLSNQNGQEIANGIYICVIKDANGVTTAKKIAVIE